MKHKKQSVKMVTNISLVKSSDAHFELKQLYFPLHAT